MTTLYRRLCLSPLTATTGSVTMRLGKGGTQALESNDNQASVETTESKVDDDFFFELLAEQRY